MKVQPGASARALSLADRAGHDWSLDALLAEAPLLLIFSDPHCGPCRELIPTAARWQDEHAGRLSVVVVSAGSPEDPHVTALQRQLRRVLVDADRSLAAAYGVGATPSAVLVDAKGTIGAAPAAGADEISSLVAWATTREGSAAFDRRGFLSRAALGVAAVTVLPVVASACGTAKRAVSAVRPKQLEIDNAWLCDQRYALCTSAACVPSKINPNISICTCRVATGYAVGFKSCDQRAPQGTQLHSNFSLQDVSSGSRVMTCEKEGLWVQCLDVVCEEDSNNPNQALCQCMNMTTTNFQTFGGNCDTSTCSSVIWSATTEPFPGGAQYEKGLKQLGIKLEAPKACTAPTQSS
jgi:thiol-disulfide isomerase/thioredoxin